MNSRNMGSKLIWSITMAAVWVSFYFVTTMEQASAVLTDVTNDRYFDFGFKYWGDKNGNTNAYPYTQAFYCQTTGGDTKSSCTAGLIDGRVNYVKHTLKIEGGDDLGYQLSLQGCDPFGQVDGGTSYVPPPECSNKLNALVHNYKFPRAPKAPTGYDYVMNAQFAWFDDSAGSPFPVSRPSWSGADVTANLLTDLWFKHKTQSSALVIDFGWASLINNNGHWTRDTIPVGDGWDIAWYEYSQGKCLYHISIMLDNFSVPNTWREPGTTNIAPYIESAFTETYTPRGSVGSCTATVPNGSTYNTNWQLIDIEVGEEMYPNNGAGSGKHGTIVDAYSLMTFGYQ
jgi:hypothetical protein